MPPSRGWRSEGTHDENAIAPALHPASAEPARQASTIACHTNVLAQRLGQERRVAAGEVDQSGAFDLFRDRRVVGVATVVDLEDHGFDAEAFGLRAPKVVPALDDGRHRRAPRRSQSARSAAVDRR